MKGKVLAEEVAKAMIFLSDEAGYTSHQIKACEPGTFLPQFQWHECDDGCATQSESTFNTRVPKMLAEVHLVIFCIVMYREGILPPELHMRMSYE